jgi:hypothetical protein
MMLNAETIVGAIESEMGTIPIPHSFNPSPAAARTAFRTLGISLPTKGAAETPK